MTETVKFAVPAVVGVPETTPAAESDKTRREGAAGECDVVGRGASADGERAGVRGVDSGVGERGADRERRGSGGGVGVDVQAVELAGGAAVDVGDGDGEGVVAGGGGDAGEHACGGECESRRQRATRHGPGVRRGAGCGVERRIVTRAFPARAQGRGGDADGIVRDDLEGVIAARGCGDGVGDRYGEVVGGGGGRCAGEHAGGGERHARRNRARRDRKRVRRHAIGGVERCGVGVGGFAGAERGRCELERVGGVDRQAVGSARSGAERVGDGDGEICDARGGGGSGEDACGGEAHACGDGSGGDGEGVGLDAAIGEKGRRVAEGDFAGAERRGGHDEGRGRCDVQAEACAGGLLRGVGGRDGEAEGARDGGPAGQHAAC